MKIKREWAEVDDVFGAVAEALESAATDGDADFTAHASEERGAYGEEGTLTLRMGDGRLFALELHEVL